MKHVNRDSQALGTGKGTGDSRLHVDVQSAAAGAFVALLCAALVIVILDVGLNRSGIVPYQAFRRLFNVAYDNSIAGWFSSALSLVAGLLAAAVGAVGRGRGRREGSAGWYMVGCLFVYLAVDDAAKVHERLGSTFDRLAEDGWLTFIDQYPSYTWQVVVGPFLLAAAVLAGIFLWRRMVEGSLRSLLLGGFGCLVTAVVLDVAEGAKDLSRWLALKGSLPVSAVRHYGRVLEEFLEMLGMICFLVLFLVVLLRSLDGLTVVTTVKCGKRGEKAEGESEGTPRSTHSW